jgi:hypothetical protein
VKAHAVKRIIALGSLLLLVLAASVQGEEIGAFFTKVNVYAYPDGPEQGRRVLVRPRRAFVVVDLKSDAQERVWLQIIYPGREQKLKGEGWTPLAPHELLSAGNRPVEIFADIVEGDDARVRTSVVPAAHLELLNVTQPSSRFPQLTWQKVRYETQTPLRPWLRAATGVFRPGKSSEFLSRIYVEMVSRNLPKEKLNRLLAGVIRVGDSPWEVERALGKPLRVHEDMTAKAKRTTWEYASLVVQFKNEVVEQIN